MSVELLDKTRKINRLLHNNTTNRFVFNDVCAVLAETLSSNILVLSKKGKILGFGDFIGDYGKSDAWNKVEVGKFIDVSLNERLLSILSTRENINLETLGFSGRTEGYRVIISPIDIAGDRLGTLFTYKKGELYGIDDIIVAEYGNAVVGLEMLRSLNEEESEQLRSRQVLLAAIGALSASEKEATKYILKEMEGREGILIASKLADTVGITRSVIVNALRKLESAGVIESRSSGMKGTYIKIKNEEIFKEFEE